MASKDHLHLSLRKWQTEQYFRPKWIKKHFGRVLNLMFDKPATWPVSYAPNLSRLYLVWLLALVVVYYACRWYGGIKRRYSYPWLSYL